MRFFPAKLLILVPLLMLAGLMPAQAEVIKDVPVSATADDATTARMNAMAQGEGAAFRQLLVERLGEKDAEGVMARATPAQISVMARSYEVKEEKVSARSYQAKLDVTFDDGMVNQFLGMAQAAAEPGVAGGEAGVLPGGNPMGTVPGGNMPGRTMPASTMQEPAQGAMTILVLPVQKQTGVPLLWEPENMWRNVWNHVSRDSKLSLRLPVGDASDKALLASEGVIGATFSQLNGLAERYQSNTVIVAEAQFNEPENNRLDVQLRSLAASYQNGMSLSYQARGDESPEDLMRRAAQDIASKLAQSQPKAQPSMAAVDGKITVLAQLGGLQDWVSLRKRLREVPGVGQIELSAISNGQADIVLHYTGNPDVLARNIMAKGMRIEQAPQYWVISF